jgi:hypothetical protein
VQVLGLPVRAHDVARVGWNRVKRVYWPVLSSMLNVSSSAMLSRPFTGVQRALFSLASVVQ